MEPPETPNSSLKRTGSGAASSKETKSSESVPPRVRKSSVAAGALSGSTTSITASTTDAPSTSSTALASKKKKKRVGVRFQEQKMFYFYDEDVSADVTSKVAAGFTSIPGVNDDRFEPLVRELIRIALVPITTAHAPFSEAQIFKYIQSAFSLNDDEWNILVDDERANWDIYKLIAALIARTKNPNFHSFYTPQTFRTEQEFQIWRNGEVQRLNVLIDRLKLLAPDFDVKYPDGNPISPRGSRGKPTRSKSRTGIEDSAGSSSIGGRSTPIISKVVSANKKSKKDASNVANGENNTTPPEKSSKRSKSGKNSNPNSARSAPGTTPGHFSPISSPRSVTEESDSVTPETSNIKDSARGNKPKNTPYKVTLPTTTPNHANESSDESKDATTTSESAEPAPWSGRGPRVAIRPLQFIGDDSSDDDRVPTANGAGMVSEGLTPKSSSARRPSAFSAGSDVPYDEDHHPKQDYSGSDPGNSPRNFGDSDDEPFPENSDESGQPRGAIRVSRKPRSSHSQTTPEHSDDFAMVEDEQAEFAERPGDYDANMNSEDSKAEVSMAPTPFEVLFRTLVQLENMDLRKQEKRIEMIIPLLDKAHEAISSQFSLDRHVNMFDALPELNPDAFVSGFSGVNFFLAAPDTTESNGTYRSSSKSKEKRKKEKEREKSMIEEHPWKVPSWDPASETERVMFGISDIGRWLLGEYAIFWGYSPVYQNLVQLNHLVAFLMPSADMLLMLYVLMTRVLDLLQHEELEPIPSALETYYFAQVMRELNRDAESAFYNMFGQFSYEDLAALKMLLNILSLIYECNEFLGEAPPKTYKAYLEQALEESVRNYYTEVVTDAEEPREVSGDPVGKHPSSAVRKRQRSERRTTANQLLAACDAMDELLTNLDPFQVLFSGLSKPLFDICCKAYIRQLFSDTSLFVIKMARTQPVSRALSLANGIIKINQLCAEHARSEVIEPLPVEKLFGSFLYDWLVQTEVTMKEWANTTCKIERWEPVDASKGKLWSACSWDLYKLVLSHIPFVLENEQLFKLTVAAEEAEMLEGGAASAWPTAGPGLQTHDSSRGLNARMSHKAIGYTAESITERKKTYFYQYSLGISRLLRDFVENVYNLFVEEFPADLHSDLHDLYIRDYYNMTTGGSGLHLMYKKKKKSIFAWLTGRRKSDAAEDNGRHASLASSSSQPKLGKKKSLSNIVPPSGPKASNSSPDIHRSSSNDDSTEEPSSARGQAGGLTSAASLGSSDGPSRTNSAGFFSASGAGLMSSYQSAGIDHNDDPNRELVINVWSMIVFDPKRVVKMRKLRKRIDIKQSMCIKLNDLDAIRAFFDRLLQTEPLFQLAVNPAFDLMHKVFRTFLHMLIYIINMHLDTEMEHIYKKCDAKKPSSSVFEAHLNFVANFADQLALMKDNLRNNIFKRVLLRLWKVIQEDMGELLNPEDDDSVRGKEGPTALQIAAMEALIDSIRPILSGYGMSVNHINTKVSELLGPHRDTISSDELEKARAVYEAERSKFMHKEKRKNPSALNLSQGNNSSSANANNGSAAPPSSARMHNGTSEHGSRKHAKENSGEPRLATTPSRQSIAGSTPASLTSSSALPSSARKHASGRESFSVSSSSAAGGPPPSTPVVRRGLPERDAAAVGRRIELNHQESASSFVREQPLTESSEEADAYSSIKSQLHPHGSGSDSESNEAPQEEVVAVAPPAPVRKHSKKGSHAKKDSENSISTSTTTKRAKRRQKSEEKEKPADE